MIWFMLESAAQKSQKTEERAAVENVFKQERDICQHLLYCASSVLAFSIHSSWSPFKESIWRLLLYSVYVTKGFSYS